MVQVLKRADRLPNGRVVDRNLITGARRVIPPPHLEPRVVKVLSLAEQIEAQSIRMQQAELMRKWKAFWRKAGLDPSKVYRMNPKTGEVIEIGNHTAHY